MTEPEKQKKNTAIDKEKVEKYRDEHDPFFQAYYRYGDSHVLNKEFLSLIAQAHISDNHLILMRDGISDMIARGVVNPCVPNGNDNDIIDSLNIRFNEAKSIDELIEVFQEARNKNIEIREEFDNAFFMIHYLKKLIQNMGEEKQNNYLKDILNFMFHTYEFIGNQWDKDVREDRNAPLTYKSTERKMMTARRHDAFKDYFKMFEDKWHPNGNKSEYSLENAVETVYKSGKLKDDNKLKELLWDYSGIDVSIENNQEAVLKKLVYYFRKYTIDYCKEHKGCTINGFKPKRRKGHTKVGKQNIGKGVKETNKKNKEIIKQNPSQP